jgi:hypothetical protein
VRQYVAEKKKKRPRLVGQSRITAAIQEAMAVRAIKVNITAEHVLQELALFGFSDIGDVLDFTGTEPRLKPPTRKRDSGTP